MNDSHIVLQRTKNEKGETILTFIFNGLTAQVKEINGKKEGKCFTFFPLNGEVDNLIEGTYTFKNDILEGEFKKFSIKGQIIEKGYYENNLLNGILTTFFSSTTRQTTNKMRQKIQYVNGVIHGSNLLFYQNGNLSLKQNFTNGVLDGECLTYSSNGTLISKCKYYNNKLIGDLFIYDNNKIIKKYCFDIIDDVSIGYSNTSLIKFHKYEYEFTCKEWHNLFTYKLKTSDEDLLKIVNNKEYFISFYKFINKLSLGDLIYN